MMFASKNWRCGVQSMRGLILDQNTDARCTEINMTVIANKTHGRAWQMLVV